MYSNIIFEFISYLLYTLDSYDSLFSSEISSYRQFLINAMYIMKY